MSGSKALPPNSATIAVIPVMATSSFGPSSPADVVVTTVITDTRPEPRPKYPSIISVLMIRRRTG